MFAVRIHGNGVTTASVHATLLDAETEINRVHERRVISGEIKAAWALDLDTVNPTHRERRLMLETVTEGA